MSICWVGIFVGYYTGNSEFFFDILIVDDYGSEFSFAMARFWLAIVCEVDVE